MGILRREGGNNPSVSLSSTDWNIALASRCGAHKHMHVHKQTHHPTNREIVMSDLLMPLDRSNHIPAWSYSLHINTYVHTHTHIYTHSHSHKCNKEVGRFWLFLLISATDLVNSYTMGMQVASKHFFIWMNEICIQNAKPILPNLPPSLICRAVILFIACINMVFLTGWCS